MESGCNSYKFSNAAKWESESIQCKEYDLSAKKQEVVKENKTLDDSRRIDISSKLEKFEQLKKRFQGIREASKLCQQKTEKFKAIRQAKKALKDSKRKNNDQESGEEGEKKWQEVKPFLTVNDHLQGPVSHGDCGPKTELECMIDDAIKGGDFEKAEILSDSLANREFAVKISNAFAAKRYSENKAEEDAALKARNVKKIRWGFEVKERWQMKGNM